MKKTAGAVLACSVLFGAALLSGCGETNSGGSQATTMPTTTTAPVETDTGLETLMPDVSDGIMDDKDGVLTDDDRTEQDDNGGNILDDDAEGLTNGTENAGL